MFGNPTSFYSEHLFGLAFAGILFLSLCFKFFFFNLNGSLFLTLSSALHRPFLDLRLQSGFLSLRFKFLARMPRTTTAIFKAAFNSRYANQQFYVTIKPAFNRNKDKSWTQCSKGLQTSHWGQVIVNFYHTCKKTFWPRTTHSSWPKKRLVKTHVAQTPKNVHVLCNGLYFL